jgi:hypothetical protein
MVRFVARGIQSRGAGRGVSRVYHITQPSVPIKRLKAARTAVTTMTASGGISILSAGLQRDHRTTICDALIQIKSVAISAT